MGISPLNASQIAEAFTHDAPFLFLGSAFITAGLISAAFAFLGHRFNAMLLWLASFSALYGMRLWLQLPIVSLVLSHVAGFRTLQAAINYLVPVPVVFFFDVGGRLQASAMAKSTLRMKMAKVSRFPIMIAGTF